MTQAHIPPNSADLERRVLCAMVFDPDSYAVARDALRASDFYAPIRGEMFSLLRSMPDVDPVMLIELLRAHFTGDRAVGAVEEWERCAELLTIAPDIEPWCRRIRADAINREVVKACMSIAAEGLSGAIEDPDDYVGRAEVEFGKAVSGREVGTGASLIGELMSRSIEALETRQRTPEIAYGLPSTLPELDAALSGGGFLRGAVYVVAGRPGMGKSALAQQCAVACSRHGHAVVFNLEMGGEELSVRMLAAETGIDSRQIAGAHLSDKDWAAVTSAANSLSERSMSFVAGTTFTIEQMRRVARGLHRKHGGLGCILVDYLQLARSAEKFQNREQEISAISRGLKLLAMELRCPVIAVSQLNRAVEARADKRPMMSDLRESGSIEQDADAILLLYRDEYYNAESAAKGICEVILGKQRGGITGTIRLRFEPRFTRFTSLIAPQSRGLRVV